MKLLFDQNLSRRLPRRIQDLFAGSTHVSSLSLLNASDRTIWQFARDNDFCIVSADSDFYDLAVATGFPPKIIWLRSCDYSTEVAEELIRSQAIRINDFLNDSEQSVLTLRPM